MGALVRQHQIMSGRTRLLSTVTAWLPHLCIVVLLFVSHVYHPVDFDLGWHLKYGEYITQYGSVLRENRFSSTMVGYPWVNATSGTDLITYLLYHAGGFPLLAVTGAAIGTGIILTFARAVRLTLLQQLLLFPLWLICTRPYMFFSFRGQLLSLGFLACLTLILHRAERDPRKLWWCIPLFLAWANTHGQLIVGFALFTVWISFLLLRLFTHRQPGWQPQVFLLAGVTCLSWIVTLVNPYGLGIWIEPLLYPGNRNLQFIAEWTPYALFSEAWWHLILAAGLVIMATFRSIRHGEQLTRWPWIIMTWLLLGFALAQRRYAWMFYGISLTVVYRLFPRRLPAVLAQSERFLITLAAGLMMGIGIWVAGPRLRQLPELSWFSYCAITRCSEQAASFLLEKTWSPPLFTAYNWGGWLIWRYPSLKPSIDGRMSLWQTNDGYSAFAEYYAWEQNVSDIDESPYNTAFISRDKPVYQRLLELERQGSWKTVYRDQAAVVVVRIRADGNDSPTVKSGIVSP